MVDDASPTGVRQPARDRVALRGLTGFGHHGVFDFERAQGQRFVVDVVCALDLAPAAETDDLQRTVDYGALAADVVADIEGEPLDLIEALADRLVELATAEDIPALGAVHIEAWAELHAVSPQRLFRA